MVEFNYQINKVLNQFTLSHLLEKGDKSGHRESLGGGEKG